MISVGTVIWVVVVTGEPHDEKLVLQAAGLTMASLGMSSSLYIALHWAFRPENLFSKSFIDFASNPLGYLLTRWTQR
jgi:hypothetical protein